MKTVHLHHQGRLEKQQGEIVCKFQEQRSPRGTVSGVPDAIPAGGRSSSVQNNNVGCFIESICRQPSELFDVIAPLDPFFAPFRNINTPIATLELHPPSSRSYL